MPYNPDDLFGSDSPANSFDEEMFPEGYFQSLGGYQPEIKQPSTDLQLSAEEFSNSTAPPSAPVSVGTASADSVRWQDSPREDASSIQDHQFHFEPTEEMVKDTRKFKRLSTIFVCAVISVFIAVMVYALITVHQQARDEEEFMNNSYDVIATIDSIDVTQTKNSYSRKASVHYEVDGQRIYPATRFNVNRNLQEGDLLRIRVSKTDPRDARDGLWSAKKNSEATSIPLYILLPILSIALIGVLVSYFSFCRDPYNIKHYQAQRRKAMTEFARRRREARGGTFDGALPEQNQTSIWSMELGRSKSAEGSPYSASTVRSMQESAGLQPTDRGQLRVNNKQVATPRKSGKAMMIIGVIWFLVLLIPFIFAMNQKQQLDEFYSKAQQVSGEVVSVRPQLNHHTDSEGRNDDYWLYYATVRYEVNGRFYTTPEEEVASSTTEGTIMTVYVDPGNPSQGKIKPYHQSNIAGGHWLSIAAVGIVIFIIGLSFYKMGRKQEKRRQVV